MDWRKKKKLKRLLKIIATIMSLIVLTGCWDQKTYERIGFVLEVGIEKGQNRDLLITSVIPVIGGDVKNASDLLVVEANSIMHAFDTNNRVSGKLLLGGRIQQLLFSDQIAEGGIRDIMNVINRDAQNSLLTYIVIVEGSPMDLMKKELTFKNKPRPGIYLNQLIKADIEHAYIPDTKIYDFDVDSFKKDKDAMVPLVKLRRDGIEAIGSALFSEDKMVGKVGVRGTKLLTSMRNKQKEDLRFHFNALQELAGSGNGKHTMSAALSLKKRKINVELKNNRPIVNIFLEYDAAVDEYKWDKTDEPNVKKRIEKIISEDVKASGDETLKYTQKIGSDPIGIGEIVRAKYNSYWQSVNWRKAYKTAEIHFNSKVMISDTGDIK